MRVLVACEYSGRVRDAFEVIKTVEGEEQDECDKLTGLCLSIAHALALYDDERRIEPPNASLEGCGAAGGASLSKRLLGTEDERN